MSGKCIYKVIKHLSEEELNRKIREQKDAALLKKLYFIKYLYKEMNVKKAAEAIGVSKTTGYVYLKKWNSEGYDGLLPKSRGGRPSKLTKNNKEELENILKGKDSWTTKEVQKLLEKKFGIKYSLYHIRRILRSFGMKYTKPYQKDYRKPDNAEEILKKT